MTEDRCMTQIMRDLETKLWRLRLMLLAEVAEDDPPIKLIDDMLRDIVGNW